MPKKKPYEGKIMWGGPERTFKRRFDSLKSLIFSPIYPLLSWLKIMPWHLSVSGAVIGLVGCAYLPYDTKTALILVFAAMFLDNLDGAFARSQNITSFKGEVTDAICDQVTAVAFPLAMIYMSLLNPIIGLAFALLSPLALFLAIKRTMLEIPRAYVLKTRMLMIWVYIAYLLFNYNFLTYFAIICDIIFIIEIFSDILRLREYRRKRVSQTL